MKLPSTPKQISLWLAVLTSITLVAAWLLIPLPNPSVDVQQAQTQWQSPNIYLFENSQQVYNQLQKRQAWGGNTDTQTKSEQRLLSKDWRLAGIVQTGQQRFALLQDIKQNKVQRYAVGDTLDNGGQLIKIYADAVEIKLAGNIDTEYLHPRKHEK